MTRLTIAPVHVSIRVEVPVDDAFRIFTEDIAAWWPLHQHSVAADTFKGKVRSVALTLDGRVGGLLSERLDDGREVPWGKILVWEPPHRIAFTWHPYLHAAPPTEVEVRFSQDGTGTRVDLDHRGWERLGESGAEKRRGYEMGWPSVLGRFAEHVGTRIT